MEIALSLIVLLFLFSAALAGLSAAPWLPTKPGQRRHLIEHLDWPDGLQVVDLGCGDGTILFAIARYNPKVICVGYDISLLPLLLGWSRKLFNPRRYRNVHIRFGNLFKQDISKADRIFVFLLNKSYPRLMEKFSTGLKAKAEVVVEAWPMPGIPHDRVLKEEHLLPMYIYSAEAFQGRK